MQADEAVGDKTTRAHREIRGWKTPALTPAVLLNPPKKNGAVKPLLRRAAWKNVFAYAAFFTSGVTLSAGEVPSPPSCAAGWLNTLRAVLYSL